MPGDHSGECATHQECGRLRSKLKDSLQKRERSSRGSNNPTLFSVKDITDRHSVVNQQLSIVDLKKEVDRARLNQARWPGAIRLEAVLGYRVFPLIKCKEAMSV